MLSEHRGHHCQHRSDDFPSIARIVARRRPTTVVELGTDRGGFAGFLADLVLPWGGEVTTIDREAKFKPALLSDFRNLRFVLGDVLQPGGHPLATELASREGALLYCDDGDKPLEVRTYAPLLRAGSLLGVHDYGSEVPSGWVEGYLAGLGYEPEGHDLMEALRNEWYEPMTRFWTRRRVP